MRSTIIKNEYSSLTFNELTEIFTSAAQGNDIKKAIEIFRHICFYCPKEQTLPWLESIKTMKASNGYTLAHFLSEVDALELAKEVKLTRELFAPDINGNNPLHIAVRKMQPNMLKVFLEALGDQSYKALLQPNDDGKTPMELIDKDELGANEILELCIPSITLHNTAPITDLLIDAIAQKNYSFIMDLMKISRGSLDLERDWINAALKLKSHSSDDAKKTFNFFKEWQKQETIAKGKLVNQESASMQTPSEIILSRSFFGHDVNLRGKKSLHSDSEFKSQLDELSSYEKAPLMAPMLSILALVGLNLHQGPEHAHKKPLKIIFTPDASLESYHFEPGKGSKGMHTGKSTLYVAVGGTDVESINSRLNILYHEGAHMVAAEVMRNDSKPYPSDRDDLKESFEQIMMEIKGQLPKMSANSEEEEQALNVLQGVFSNYEPEKWAVEMIVVVPQTMAILGYKEGYQWLKDNTPKLLNYYENHFIPACNEYLVKHNATQNLKLSDNYKVALDSLTPTADKGQFAKKS